MSNFLNVFEAIVLGLVEGLTEFLPVSSTAHILLLGKIIGFDSPGKTFEVLIQLGAILAIVGVYFGKIISLLKRAPHDPQARNFIVSVLVAFLPAALMGALLHSYIKLLFHQPLIICIMLVLGGIILIVVDRMPIQASIAELEKITLKKAFLIGCCQVLAMIPGVSRSGATIVGAMLLGAQKRVAAEFSFYLAMPTMAGAFAYDLYKNYKNLNMDDGLFIVVGFVSAFFAGLFVVKRLLDYVSSHGFSIFGWWRIAVGTLGFIYFF